MAFTPTPEQDNLVPVTKGAVRAFCYVSTSRKRLVNLLPNLSFQIAWRMATRAPKRQTDTWHSDAQHRLEGRASKLRHQ